MNERSEPNRCPKCGCTEYKPIEATAIPDVDVVCIKCGTAYKSNPPVCWRVSGGAFICKPNDKTMIAGGGGSGNEPTTEERELRIVKHELRIMLDGTANTFAFDEMKTNRGFFALVDKCITRLERDLAAEKARADAAVAAARRFGGCSTCGSAAVGLDEEPCVSCDSYDKWVLRGSGKETV